MLRNSIRAILIATMLVSSAACGSALSFDAGLGDLIDAGPPDTGVGRSPFTPLGEGTDSRVEALAQTSGGILYAGGAFVTAGGRTVNNVAAWDGTTWSALGPGIDEELSALALDSADVLHAGPAIPPRTVRRWDGTAWSTLADGPPDAQELHTMIFDANDQLFVGGQFVRIPHARVAAFDGTSWRDFGDLEPRAGPRALALAVASDGTIYASFSIQTPAEGIVVRWSGTAWEMLGSGMNDTVNALAVDSNGTLYAGGPFTRAGNVIASGVARWDGAAWQALGDGVTEQGGGVFALAVDDANNLYVGGDFTRVEDQPAQSIARWDGTSWIVPRGGPFGSVRALSVESTGTVHAAGDFAIIRYRDGREDLPAKNIVRWDSTVP